MNFFTLASWVSTAIDGVSSAMTAWVWAQLGVLYEDVVEESADRKKQQGVLQAEIASVIGFLGALWDWLHNHILNKIFDLLCKIQDFLRRILSPLLCIIRWLRCWQQYVFDQYVKPIYDFLQRLRSVLVIFRLLHLKWAQTLDARIVALENAITQPTLWILANLNRLADWINYILDPVGLFQPSVWLASIQRSVGAIIAIILGQMNDPGYTGPANQYVTPADYYQADAMLARIQMRYAVGDLPDDTACLASLRASAAALGYLD